MSKLREKVAGLLLNLARKVDGKTVESKCTYPAAQLHFLDSPPIITYDEHHVEKIHAEHMISDAKLDAYRHNLDFDVDDIIRRGLIDEISKIIYDSHKDDVKKTFRADSPYNPSTLFTLDVYVCKPQKKEIL